MRALALPSEGAQVTQLKRITVAARPALAFVTVERSPSISTHRGSFAAGIYFAARSLASRLKVSAASTCELAASRPCSALTAHRLIPRSRTEDEASYRLRARCRGGW